MQEKLMIEEKPYQQEISRLMVRIEVLELSLEEIRRLVNGLVRSEFQKMRELVLTEEIVDSGLSISAPLSK